jgi:acetylglutamate/LysW-gamma-L-alpha-aminoadipate kinase
LLEKFPDESSLIKHIPKNKIDQFMSVAEDRMKKKVMGAQEALAEGIGRIVFADGRVEQPVRRGMAGEGTVIGE